MNQNWDSKKYSEGFSFVYQYGSDVLNLIQPEGVVKAIDLGCGTGILTKALKDKGFDVTGLDSSEEMLLKARANYPDIEFAHADAVNFALGEPVDLVFSNAVLHWIDKSRQLSMMKCVYDALRDNGQFIFEMGGSGCGRLIHEKLAERFNAHGYSYAMPFYFPAIGEYASLLEQTGFTVRYAVLFDRPTQLKGNNGLYDWIKMFVNIPFEGVKESDRENILLETVEGLRDKLFNHESKIWFADYVRLRIRAVKE